MVHTPCISSFVLVVCVVINQCTLTNAAFAISSRSLTAHQTNRGLRPGFINKYTHSTCTPNSATATDDDTTLETEKRTSPASQTLPQLYPSFASSLSTLQYSTPTPIQASSTPAALRNENLLLIAPTGSGKTLAYLLPAMTNAMDDDADGTVLILAPTRELALQLARTAEELLTHLPDVTPDEARGAVTLAVRGMPSPLREDVATSRILVGTPPEIRILAETGAAGEFLEACRVVVLDEVDELLPVPSKTTRTSLDDNDERAEVKKRAQKRKREALKRRFGDAADVTTGRVVTPTERVLMAVYGVASSWGSSDGRVVQILAGSATASRKTEDVLNRALANAVAAGGGGVVRAGSVTVVRPGADDGTAVVAATAAEGTPPPVASGRSVTVPSQVSHRYVSLSKQEAASADDVLKAVAATARSLLPPQQQRRTKALLFICGEFGRSSSSSSSSNNNTDPRTNARRSVMAVGKKKRTSRNVKQKIVAAQREARSKSGQAASISARNVCAKLQALGLEARPLHVALGLEANAAPPSGDGDDDSDDESSFYVTFEKSARGLHVNDVDVVFVMGRPASASSYLHLAGRVGRWRAGGDGGASIRPGTVVSFCTKGGSKELEKWTRLVGGTDLEEIVFDE